MSHPPSVHRLQEYLRIRTDHPSPDYASAVSFFERYTALCPSLKVRREEPVPGHPIAILTFEGSVPSAASLVLSGHMDVVPAEEEKWTVPAFEGVIVGDRVYSRGGQDMKASQLMYVEALVRLIASRGGAPFRRSVHVLCVPDEEVGGARGMQALLGTPQLVSFLNPGVLIDEGLASPDDKFSVFYGERKIIWTSVNAKGPAGHGSRFLPNTAVSTLHKFLARVEDFHNEQRALLAAACGCGKQLGDFATANVTMLHAGDHTRLQYNVVPTAASAGVDFRLPATLDLLEFKARLDSWCAETGGDITYTLVLKDDAPFSNPVSKTTDSKWWDAFSAAAAAADAPLHEPSIFPAATDARWVRSLLGVPAFGFSPMRRLPILLHDHDEYITLGAYAEGISIWEKMIPILAEQGAELD